MMQSVCCFCGSSFGNDTAYEAAARALGEEIAARGWRVVYGGGRVGLMGVLADAVLARGGTVIGIIPKALSDLELSHLELSELHVVGSMHERKALMCDLSDGVVALPGGFGTFEELFEMLTWAQLGFHDKPCGVLNVAGYYDQLLTFLHHTVDQGFIKPVHRDLLYADSRVNDLLDAMTHHVAPKVQKWIERP